MWSKTMKPLKPINQWTNGGLERALRNTSNQRPDGGFVGIPKRMFNEVRRRLLGKHIEANPYIRIHSDWTTDDGYPVFRGGNTDQNFGPHGDYDETTVEELNTLVGSLKNRDEKLNSRGRRARKLQADLGSYKAALATRNETIEGLQNANKFLKGHNEGQRGEIAYHKNATRIVQEQFENRGVIVRDQQGRINYLQEEVKALKDAPALRVTPGQWLSHEAMERRYDELVHKGVQKDEEIRGFQHTVRERRAQIDDLLSQRRDLQRELRALKGMRPEPPRYTRGGEHLVLRNGGREHTYYIDCEGRRIGGFKDRSVRDRIIDQLNDNEG